MTQDDRSSAGCRRPANRHVLGVGFDSQVAFSGLPVACRPFEAGDVIQNPRCELHEAER